MSDDAPSGPWLSHAEQEAWRSYVTATSVVGRLLDRALKARGLSPEDYGILAMLSEAPDHQLRLGELASQLRLPKPFLTYRFQRLEQSGLVERRQCPTDARSAFCVLTDAGVEMVTLVAPEHVASVRGALFDHLSPAQIGQLGRIMVAVIDGIDSSENECGSDCETSEP